MDKKVWLKIKKHIGYKVPNFLKIILNFAGFDNGSSLLLLNESLIKEIEANLSSLIGHRALLIEIPNIIKNIKKSPVTNSVNVNADDNANANANSINPDTIVNR